MPTLEIDGTLPILQADEPRPFGLCAGEFVVPDDFDAPLPEDILRDFEGAWMLEAWD